MCVLKEFFKMLDLNFIEWNKYLFPVFLSGMWYFISSAALKPPTKLWRILSSKIILLAFVLVCWRE